MSYNSNYRIYCIILMITMYFLEKYTFFKQLSQLDQLNWHLYDADLVGQTVKIGQIFCIFYKI